VHMVGYIIQDHIDSPAVSLSYQFHKVFFVTKTVINSCESDWPVAVITAVFPVRRWIFNKTREWVLCNG